MNGINGSGLSFSSLQAAQNQQAGQVQYLSAMNIAPETRRQELLRQLQEHASNLKSQIEGWEAERRDRDAANTERQLEFEAVMKAVAALVDDRPRNASR